ncbi:MAG: VTT domain-containing protein, partial [Limisphaerales bacterium]
PRPLITLFAVVAFGAWQGFVLAMTGILLAALAAYWVGCYLDRDTVRRVAAEERTELIDLQAMSLRLYRALGADLDRAFQDGTHHNNYGAYLLAQCVAQGLRDHQLPLADKLAADFASFGPDRPAAWTTFAVPASPLYSEVKPEGN